jgi:hypothetical protein
LCLSFSSYSQEINSTGNKILITYEKGHSDWGNPGTYSVIEKIELAKSKDDSTIFRTSGIVIRKYVETKGMIYKSDTLYIPTTENVPVKSSTVNYFLSSLNQSKNNFTLSFILPYLNIPSRREIFTIAEKYNLEKRLSVDYISKKSRRLILKRIKKFYDLDSFLSLMKNTSNTSFVMHDAWNYCSIAILTQTDSLHYSSQFSQPLGQPYVRKNRNSNDSNIVNLEINLALMEILPASSGLRQQLDFNSLKKEYIKWYLEFKL